MADEGGVLKSYRFSLALLVSILAGSAAGALLRERAAALKPFGDVFLNLLFTIVVPMVFFSMASAVARTADLRRLGRVLGWMLVVFVATGIVSSLLMAAGVTLFPPAVGAALPMGAAGGPERTRIAEQLVGAFTAPDFAAIISRKSMLALIVFSLLVGVATVAAGEQGRPFARFLESGNAVMAKAVSFVMLYAPLGLGAYFAWLVGVFGPELLGSYARAMALYYPLTFFYFFAAFTAYAYVAGRSPAVRRFWTNILPPSLTALATGSSVAAIPANLEAARKIGVPRGVREVVIPIGATIHMDGSCLAAVLKIAVLFGLFGVSFTGVSTISTAVLVAILCGVVISGIPAGGILGETLIITMYGFPVEALPVVTMIGTLVDPPATMVNSVGDTVAGMVVARITGGRDWEERDADA